MGSLLPSGPLSSVLSHCDALSFLRYLLHPPSPGLLCTQSKAARRAQFPSVSLSVPRHPSVLHSRQGLEAEAEGGGGRTPPTTLPLGRFWKEARWREVLGWGAYENLAVVAGVRAGGPGGWGTGSHCVSTMSTDSLPQQGNPLAPGREKEVRAGELQVGTSLRGGGF